MINLNLQYPNVLVRIVPDYANYETPPLEDGNYYAEVIQLNNATIGHAVGDIGIVKIMPGTPSFFNNGIQYFFVDEHMIFSTIDNITNKIFDFTFDYTFE